AGDFSAGWANGLPTPLGVQAPAAAATGEHGGRGGRKAGVRMGGKTPQCHTAYDCFGSIFGATARGSRQTAQKKVANKKITESPRAYIKNQGRSRPRSPTAQPTSGDVMFPFSVSVCAGLGSIGGPLPCAR
ncbi:MAG: hypothetical protein ACPIOQ_58055, partial [Promethearchaeia archaeon]